MARPNKYNLHYFPLDVIFFDDHKTILIEEDFGVKGGYLAIRLLAMVYEQGYYLEWKDKSEVTIAKRVGNGFTGALVMEVLKSCLKHGLFDKTLFYKNNVLTSTGIQKRWLQVMNQLRRKVDVSNEIWLISSEETQASTEETITPETLSTQKEIKLNEIKEDVVSGGEPPPKQTLEEKQKARINRMAVFRDDVKAFSERYPKEMLVSFYEYWKEPNKSKTKMKFEMEDTWELNLRLARWEKNNYKFNKGSESKTDCQTDKHKSDYEKLLQQRKQALEEK